MKYDLCSCSIPRRNFEILVRPKSLLRIDWCDSKILSEALKNHQPFKWNWVMRFQKSQILPFLSNPVVAAWLGSKWPHLHWPRRVHFILHRSIRLAEMYLALQLFRLNMFLLLTCPSLRGKELLSFPSSVFQYISFLDALLSTQLRRIIPGEMFLFH